MTKKPLILIVEDEPRQAEDFVHIVNDSGKFTPLLAHNGKEALAILKKHRRFLGFAHNAIKCIVTDIRMPELNGVDFIKILRNQERQFAWRRHIPVLFLTAFDDNNTWKAASNLEHGRVAGYLTKPLAHPRQLTDALCRIVLDHETEVMMDDVRETSYYKM